MKRVQNTKSTHGDIIWLGFRHTLSEILNNCKLPVLVKVAEGFMLDEDNCLASETILTIHGQEKIKRLLAKDQTGKELHIPLECKYRFRIKPYDESQIYETIRDAVSSPHLPDCLENRKEFKFHGVSFPAATVFNVQTIYRGKYNEPLGLSVITHGPKAVRVTLPLSVRGSFISIPLRDDRMRTYVISEVTKRKFPLFIEFIPTNETNPIYSPRLGTVTLNSIYESTIVFATYTIENKKYLSTFSCDLKVELQIGQITVEEDENTYLTIAEPDTDDVNLEQLKGYLVHADPHFGTFNFVYISDVEENVDTRETKVEESGQIEEKPPVPARSGSRRKPKYRQGSIYASMHGDQTGVSIEENRDQSNEYEEIILTTNNSPDTKRELILPDNTADMYSTIKENKGRNVYTPDPVKSNQPPRVLPKPKVNKDDDNIDNNGIDFKKCTKDNPMETVENGSQSSLDGSANLVKVLAFSLPLDAAAKLQCEFMTDELDTTACEETKSQLPLQSVIQNPSYETCLEIGHGIPQNENVVKKNENRDSTPPPPILPRKDKAKSGRCLELEEGGLTENPSEEPNCNQEILHVSHCASQDDKTDTVMESIAMMSDEDIVRILVRLNLSEFTEAFKEQQINGELLQDLEEVDLIDSIGMTAFQARKLLLYIRGWRTDDEATAEGTNTFKPDKAASWTIAYLDEQLQMIKLPSFAEFCKQNQVNGSLIKHLLDEKMMQSIREDYGVKLSRIEEKKLRNFVNRGWRPTSLIK